MGLGQTPAWPGHDCPAFPVHGGSGTYHSAQMRVPCEKQEEIQGIPALEPPAFATQANSAKASLRSTAATLVRGKCAATACRGGHGHALMDVSSRCEKRQTARPESREKCETAHQRAAFPCLNAACPGAEPPVLPAARFSRRRASCKFVKHIRWEKAC